MRTFVNISRAKCLLLSFIGVALLSFPLSANVVPPVEVSPEIHQLSDLKGMTCVQFLSVLQKQKYPEYIFWTEFKTWIRKDDISSLLALVDSNESCSTVALSVSSFATLRKSTVGQEALYMLEGYRKGRYPPSLNSGFFQGEDKSELIKWAQSQEK